MKENNINILKKFLISLANRLKYGILSLIVCYNKDEKGQKITK